MANDGTEKIKMSSKLVTISIDKDVIRKTVVKKSYNTKLIDILSFELHGIRYL